MRDGVYHNDYSPRYGEGYDIYRKAADHARQLKKRRNHKNSDLPESGMNMNTEYLMTDPAQVGMSQEYLSCIDDVMERSIHEKYMKGMVTLVARHGKIVHFKAYGEAREGQPMKRNAIFRLASMSKTIGAAALMQLYDRGLVMPSDRLSEYIPAFSQVKVAIPGNKGEMLLVPPKREITIHDLLTMTSGITAVRALDENDPAARYCAACYKEAGIIDTMHPLDTTIGEVTEAVSRMPIAAQPGERWDYTNLSSIILGRVVEIVSGQDLNTYLQENIFDPLQMKATAFFQPEDRWDRIPAVYACETMERLDALDVPGTDDTRLPFARECSYYNIAAGLTGTAYDYFKFAQMLCNEGEYKGARILSPNAVKLMTFPHTRGGVKVSPYWADCSGLGSNPGPSIYGHQWGYMMDVQDSYNTVFNYTGIGSYGWHGYWGSVYNVWPEKDLVAIFLSQVSPVGLSWKTQERFLNVVANAVTDEIK